METTYFRFLDKHEGDKRAVFNNTFTVVAFTSAVFVLSVFAFRDSIAATLAGWLGKGADFNDFRQYVFFFALILAADALAVVPFARIRSAGRPYRYAFIKLANIVTVVSFNLIFILVLPKWLENGQMAFLQLEQWYRPGWLGYVFVSNLIASVLTLVLLLPECAEYRPQLDKALLRKMLTYSFPILIANISFVVNELLDKMFFIPRLLPAEQAATDLGIYGAVSKLAIFLSIAVQAFRLGAEPFFFSYAKEANSRRVYAIIMDYFIILMVFAMVALTVNIEWLKYFIKAADPIEQAKYWSGLKIIPVLMLSYVFLGIYTNLSIWYKLSDQTKYALYISGIGALVTIALNLIFVPKYSYVGAAWVTLAAYLVMVVISYYWGQKNYAIPYHVGRNLIYILAGSLISWASFDLFDSNLFIGNGMLLVFATAIVAVEYKNLKRLLKPGAL